MLSYKANERGMVLTVAASTPVDPPIQEALDTP